MVRLGLTGGIGSGKSTVAKILVEQGATLIDADDISRATTASGGAAITLIAAQFGPGVVNADGSMNRGAMRQRIFSDSNARQQLEAIIHPLVSNESARQAEVARQAGCALLVFDIPLLVESSRWRNQLDRVLVVDCEGAAGGKGARVRPHGQPGAEQRNAVPVAVGQGNAHFVRQAAGRDGEGGSARERPRLGPVARPRRRCTLSNPEMRAGVPGSGLGFAVGGGGVEITPAPLAIANTLAGSH